MKNKRLELVQEAVTGFVKVAHGLHNQKNLPFGNCLLNKQQILILFFIYNQKDLTSVNDLAKFLNVTPGAVTQFIDSLIKKGLVLREKNLEDKRVVNIKLSPDLKIKFNNFKNDYLSSASHYFNRLNENDLKQLILLLKKIKTADNLSNPFLQVD